MKPSDIEALSFHIIEEEAGEHRFDEREWSIVRRMIHTTADFEYLKTIRFHPLAIERGIQAIRGGKMIVTDTTMAAAGIRKAEAGRFGASVRCMIGDSKVREIAEREGTTRARAAVDAAAPFVNGGIYVVGNAPTALLRLLELAETDGIAPALVIGLPVGFVNAAESKAALNKTDIPHITNLSRKGGSAVAASVVNALGIMACG